MKADPKIQQGVLVLSVLVLPILLGGCLDGDEQLQQAVRDLRAEVQKAKETNQALAVQLDEAKGEIKAMESKVEANGGAKTAEVNTEQTAELKAALEKIAELESMRGAELEAKPVSLTAESLRKLASELQADLMTKVNELSDMVQAKIPSADLQEVTVKRIHPPEEVATAFTSAITFTFLDANRQPMPLRFPVQAGLDGSWRVPTVEDVQRVFTGVASGEVQVTAPAQALAAAPAQAAPSVPATGSAAAPTQPQEARPTFDKQADGSIVINWDSNAAPPVAQAPAPVVPSPNPAASVPSQAAAPPPVVVPPAAAAPQKPTIPAPVMPVQQDIIVRFD